MSSIGRIKWRGRRRENSLWERRKREREGRDREREGRDREREGRDREREREREIVSKYKREIVSKYKREVYKEGCGRESRVGERERKRK